MPFWRCSTGILRRPSSAYVSGGGQTQSHFGTIAARNTRRFGTTFPTSVMVIALPSAAISLFDNIGNRPQAPEEQLLATSCWLLAASSEEQEQKQMQWQNLTTEDYLYLLPCLMMISTCC